MNSLKISHRWFHSIAGLACGCVLVVITQVSNANESSAEQQAAKYPDSALYTIRRKGKKVGTHWVNFSNNGTGLNVEVESKITISILKVPVYRFNYVATEQWNNGRLIGVNARTNNGGEITNAEYAPNSNAVVAFSSNH